jgi:hypothetical protein
MKVGDLVSFADVGQPDLTIGLVVDMNTVFVFHGLPAATESPFVGVLWVGSNGHIDYEREEWLEVVNESR